MAATTPEDSLTKSSFVKSVPIHDPSIAAGGTRIVRAIFRQVVPEVVADAPRRGAGLARGRFDQHQHFFFARTTCLHCKTDAPAIACGFMSTTDCCFSRPRTFTHTKNSPPRRNSPHGCGLRSSRGSSTKGGPLENRCRYSERTDGNPPDESTASQTADLSRAHTAFLRARRTGLSARDI